MLLTGTDFIVFLQSHLPCIDLPLTGEDVGSSGVAFGIGGTLADVSHCNSLYFVNKEKIILKSNFKFIMEIIFSLCYKLHQDNEVHDCE